MLILMLQLHETFTRYTDHDIAMPVWNLTPSRRGCFHRFFDTWPISPSGRYLAVLQMSDEFRLNQPGDSAAVVLVDLQTGEDRVVAQTYGWEMQMGANLNWGEDDHTLVFNDVDTSTWTPMLVRLDPLRGTSQRTPGGVYHVSPDGRFAAAASTERMAKTQWGYGVRLPDEHVSANHGAPDDDGLFITDLQTGERQLVMSLSDATKVITDWEDEPIDQWQVYGFHTKWSPDGSRLIFTVRRFLSRLGEPWNNMKNPNGQVMRFDVLTCEPDGSDVHNAVPARYWHKGGHHINWYPDSQQLSMNLGHFADHGLQFVKVDFDGSGLEPILQNVPGSGHPTIHPSGHILTDVYYFEKPWADDDGTTPLRWVNIETGQEREIVRFASSVKPLNDGALRLDPHPVWDPSQRWVVFNGVKDNSRTVYLADMSPLIGS